MNKVKVTAVVPIYNVEEYLAECLESLAQQTLQGIEVLMIDDGSTDNSARIAKEFENKYDNFHYFYKTNGGLGNARNYAIPFVKGEYLIFVDSDDVVPPYAYQKMYEMAINTGNDMIIGNVKRFNSVKEWDSTLHRKLFDASYEHTHIYQKPELVYDTTSWNKLFKTSFYKENNFKFPENILYEDIPVTIPAHFKANSIGMIDDICYLWRVRDGVSKSITQNRNEIKNLSDRLEILKMVNHFYSENITDPMALYMKDFKWLDVDLKLYVNELLNVNEEYAEFAMEAISNFLDTIDYKVLKEIRMIDRLKYYYIKKKNIDKVREVLKFQKTAFKSCTIQKKNGHYISNIPYKDVPKDILYMEKELSNYNPAQGIEQVKWDNNDLLIKGYFYLPKLKNQNDFNTEVYLENIYTGQKINILFKKLESKDITSKYGRKYSASPKRIAKYNYDNSRYEMRIPIQNCLNQNGFNGIYKIKVHYYNDVVDNTFVLSKNLDGMTKGNFLKTFEDKKIYIRFVSGNDLEICVNDYDSVEIAQLDENNQTVYLNAENKSIQLDFNCYPYGLTKLHSITREKDYYLKDNNHLFISQNENTYLLSNDDKGCFSLTKYKKVLFLDKFEKNKNSLFVKLKVSSEVVSKSQLKPEIILRNVSYNYLISFPVLQKLEDGFTTFVFEINFDNIEDVKNLAAGKYKLYLQFDAMQRYEVVGYFNQHLSFVNEQYKYHFFVDSDGYLVMHSSYVWNKKENTKSKRRLIKKYVYPLLRRLPIHNNIIVFESFWGGQYSCNPQYLYEYIQKNYPQMKCVWLLKDERILINGNAERVRKNSYMYYYYLATAKYFVNNVNFHKVYEKRKGQIEVQTMHGTPLKTLGLDVKEDFPTEEVKADFLRKCHRWDYLIVQSNWTATYTKKCYDFHKEFLRTGYPRNDMLFDMNNEKDINHLKNKMGLPLDKKVILYAPTWRRRNYFEMKLDIEDMKERLGDDYVLLLRLHHFSVAGLKETMLNEFVYNFSSYPSIQDLYLISDIMITDYSSVMFDYSILRRPILFFTYDLEEYRDNLRGLNFDFEKLAPGPLLSDYQKVVKCIENIDKYNEEYREKYNDFVNTFTSYEKGEASKRICERIFK